jgi:hypothetical protein
MRLVKVIGLVAVLAAIIAVSASAFAIVNDPLPVGVVGTPYAVKPEIRGGGEPFAFSLEGGTLPDGMKIRDYDACICGTPLTYGTFVFNIYGKCCWDSVTQTTDSPEFTLTIRAKVTITTNSLPAAAVNQPYTATLTTTTSGGYALTWSLSEGALPAGLTLNADGTITGTPTAVGSSTFKVRVKDVDGGPQTDTKSLTLSVVAPLSASAPTPPASEVGRPFKLQLSAAGGSAPLAWSLTGNAPAGLTIGAASGLISGVPTAAGTFNFSAKVIDADGQAASVPLSVKVARALALTTTRLTPAVSGQPYSKKLRAIGGSGQRTWSVIGRLPKGLRLGRTTGVLSGTPTKAGTFRFRVRVTDALKASATRAYSLSVQAGY